MPAIPRAIVAMFHYHQFLLIIFPISSKKMALAFFFTVPFRPVLYISFDICLYAH